MNEPPSPHYDPDLQEALVRGGERGLAEARAALCKCGHPRSAHFAATGALGSMGGSACENCWQCATFTPLRATALAGATFSPEAYPVTFAARRVSDNEEVWTVTVEDPSPGLAGIQIPALAPEHGPVQVRVTTANGIDSGWCDP